VASFSQAQPIVRAKTAQRGELANAWITAREAFWLALETLNAHRLRSFLTLLGVVISTTTLIVVMSIVNGMNNYIADHIANLGANVFIVHQFQWAQGEEEWLKARRRNPPMRMEDYQFLKETVPDYKMIGASAWIRTAPSVRYKGQSIEDTSFQGVTPGMISIGQAEVLEGR